MSKKILFCTLFILIFLIPAKQDPNGKTWERHNTTVHADSIIAAVDHGEDIKIDNCEIFGAFKKWGTKEKPDTIKNFISISNTTFFDSVSFKYCYFMREVRFFASTLGRMSFYEVTFTKHADFSFTTFAIEADFWHTTFGEKIDLSLIEFEDIYLSWKQLDGHLICDVLTSYMLMRYFEENREFDNADGFYLYMKDQERIGRKWYITYPEYWFIQLTCGYGVKPLRTLIVCALVIILFSALYTKTNSIREIEKEFGHRRRRRRYRVVRKGFGKRFYDALYFSVHTFIIGVVSDWHPTDEFLIKTKRIRLFKFRTLSMIEGALGWILLVLFVVTSTRKFIR